MATTVTSTETIEKKITPFQNTYITECKNLVTKLPKGKDHVFYFDPDNKMSIGKPKLADDMFDV